MKPVKEANVKNTELQRESISLQWRHNGRYGVSNHQPHDCLLKWSFRRRSKKISKLRVTGLCAGNSPMTAKFPAQMASNAENVSIWWRHHDIEHLLRGGQLFITSCLRLVINYSMQVPGKPTPNGQTTTKMTLWFCLYYSPKVKLAGCLVWFS